MNGSRGPNTAKSGTFIHFGKVDSVNGCTSATVWEFREYVSKNQFVECSEKVKKYAQLTPSKAFFPPVSNFSFELSCCWFTNY